VIRNIYSLSILVLCTKIGRFKSHVLFLQFFLIACTIFWGAYLPSSFVTFYKVEYLFFPISLGWVTFKLFREEPRTRQIFVLRSIALAWTFILIMEVSVLWGGNGAYTAPALVALLTVVVSWLKLEDTLREERISRTATQILQAIESNETVEKVLEQIASIAHSGTHFRRVSAYIDSFCLGHATEPSKTFYRVMERGYQKDTRKDQTIHFHELRGKTMAKAVESGNITLSRGAEDKAWYIIVPVGKHACINLSDTSAVSTFVACESLEIMSRLHPALQPLDRRLIEIGTKQSLALQKLRSLRGDGSWNELIGSIFIDVNNYSKLTDQYGNTFSTFVSEVYIPSLAKTVAQFACLEQTAGDGGYFVVISDLLPSGESIHSGAVRTVELLDLFMFGAQPSVEKPAIQRLRYQ
jgi:hypothetical protein